ncbi:UDP-N-acetylglucosamine--N-acetylmuramyl-(pentapeptide) pyrophosphoryl-undecaprenol N-acetylglucosamine transferase [Verrucomicrobium spinosum]|uniref:UDP-N-acetylglucosamine--N-acetylmuramyl- (pentapeptide) pyrophosphoryl-undecaprenol N-acetylglucosamine transferase n=1 Tax=Verrucomicrobium spinosum TaxID=2736 RepID=UPI00210EB453|nr:UDP-N-acetylglucosamine--N-acetylmuramyl-(pentapeptide) pyrophosphoryl-undecaprenol N-acetylglucosamine transferase [Verrucomicrobium spinosum]
MIGGSQGAAAEQCRDAYPGRTECLGVQMLHITGPGDYQEVSDAYDGKEIKLHAHIAAFCHRMELAYKIADIALARSGASTLAELAYFGVPSLLVPYPYAADDHQTLNARIFHEAKAGIMVPELDLSPEKLIRVVREITTNEQRAANMKAAAQAISHASAAEEIANIVEEMAVGK